MHTVPREESDSSEHLRGGTDVFASPGASLTIELPRLRLVAATAPMLDAARVSSEALELALGAALAASWPPPLYAREDVERSLTDLRAPDAIPGFGSWFIVRRATAADAAPPVVDSVVGIVGLSGPPTANGVVMLGYSLVPEAQGAGLATEAAAALVAFACGHPRVARVAAETFPSLLPSIRVLTRLGFERVPDAEEPGAIRFERHRDVDLVARHPLLARHGWNERLATAYRSCADARDLPGRVLATHRTRLVVALPLGNVVAAPDADMRRAVATDSRARPSTGDWVIVRSTEPSTGPATVRMILPRATTIVRRAPGTAAAPQVLAANVDVALIVVALTEPLNLRRLERFLTLAWESDVQPLVVLTKADAVSGAGTVAGMVAAVRAAVPGVETVTVSATDHVGLTILRARLGPGITAVLLGPSGVGKSTLLNRLAGQEVVATGAVRRDGGGRHTTTRRELHGLPWGALVIDTPGMRELQLWAGHEGLEHTFQDIATLAGSCRFRDCAHDAEPGCAVRGAVARGALEPQRLASWQKLAREAARAAREHDVHAAAAARARVRSSHRALEARLREKYD